MRVCPVGASDTDLLSHEVIESNVFELADHIPEILDKKYFKKADSFEVGFFSFGDSEISAL